MKEKPPFKLFGIFGYPLSHTLSPRMQEAAFEKAGLKAFYTALELEPGMFRLACKDLGRFSLDGFNVTVPYKQAVMPYLDNLTPEARAVGAVNTVFKKHQKWTGTNTDVSGFLISLKTEGRFNPKGRTVLVFGSGGAARAVVYALASAGIKKILISNRNAARAQQLVKEFKKRFVKTGFETVKTSQAVKEALHEADLVVNATSLGLKPKDEAVVPAGMIPRAGKTPKLFFDLIYHVPETAFMKSGKSRGHRVLGGLGMLLFQGAKAFEIWTGKKAPIEVMRRALTAGLKGGK